MKISKIINIHLAEIIIYYKNCSIYLKIGLFPISFVEIICQANAIQKFIKTLQPSSNQFYRSKFLFRLHNHLLAFHLLRIRSVVQPFG